MGIQRIYLDPNDEGVYIDAYIAAGSRDAVIIAPGGGYCMVCEDREGAPIAAAYNRLGVSAFVLNYRVRDSRYPSQLIDICRAVLYVRQNANSFGISPDRIFTLGFSAGGHLAGSSATLYRDPAVLEALGVTPDMIKPNGAILCYPVVTAMEITHQNSFENLTGLPFAEIPEATRRALSLEYALDSETPPLFIWHTATDGAVPPIGSIRLCERAVLAGVNASLHIYPYGPHGIALGTEETAAGNPDFCQPLATGWVADSVNWLKTL